MIPSKLVPYHDSLTAMRIEFDALALDLASVRTSASRLADAAAKAAIAAPVDVDCGLGIVAGLNEISGGMRGLASEFALMQEAIGAHAVVCARGVRNFELSLRK